MQRPNLPMMPRALLAVLLALALTGCGSNASSSHDAQAAAGTPKPSQTSSSTSSPAVPTIVGRWSQLHSCRVLVHAFQAAGLGKLAALQAAAFTPSNSSTQTPQQLMARAKRLEAGGNLCAGAPAPFRHSHFFTNSGSFGSVDSYGQQVDNGSYRVQSHFMYINGSKFRYRVAGGDRLSLTPVISPKQRRQALAHPLQFTPAVWMVNVAYAGSIWDRAPCQNWC